MKKYKSIFLPEIKEAVIRTNRYEKLLNETFDKLFTDIPIKDDPISILNIVFQKYYISFILEENKNQTNTIIRGKAVNNKVHDIYLFCNSNVKDVLLNTFRFDVFHQECIRVLRHELVHRGQYINERKQFMPERESLDSKGIKYYSSVYEIMAFANMIVEEMRFNGFTDEQILQKIKYKDIEQTDNEIIYFYQKHFTNYKDVINKLYKYIYEYIKGEAKNIL